MNRKQDLLCGKCGKRQAVVGWECAECLLGTEYPFPGIGKNVQDSPEPTGQDFDDEQSEREERRQYREWRNDSGV